MSGNTKDKIAVCNNAGKTTPAATAPMANPYANATVLEKIENLAATFRHRKCNETSSRFLFLNIKGNDKSYQTPLFSQFEVQDFCDNLVEEVVKALKDVSKIQKKSITTRAPVAKPSLFINEKPKESDLVFDDEETNGVTCFEPEHPSIFILSSQNFEEDPFDYPHQGPLLGTMRPMDTDLCPIFDEEDDHLDDDLGRTFDEKALSITSIIMENQLYFDSGTTPTPLSTYIQEHCEKLDLIDSLPEMFVKISSEDVKRFGFDKVKEFRVSNSIFENMINSFQVFEPDKLSDQKRFQNGNNIHSDLVLSFDQFLEHSKSFDHLEKSFELDLQQPILCAIKSFDSFVFKENSFNLNSYRHALITSKMDLRSNPFQEGENDAPLGSAPGKTDMRGLIMGRSKDICSLFDSYLPNHEASMHEITWRMLSTQLRSSSKKNQIKRSSYVTVMPFTNQVIFSSREFRPPEKLEMSNILSDEQTTNSIMPKVIIHVLNVQESLGLDGFQKDSNTDLFEPNGETDKILAKGKDEFRPDLKGTCLGPYQEHIIHFSKSWSWLFQEAVQVSVKDFI
ncbi:hypothetical protein F2Q69_00012231 [Brassica cretica]|uniref:Uncharacterized protein n=1 Tax=Brassica cretica TaxID=69181 RepID=A0A8S9R9V6_BRACR|nr:hypothetical protein F2Q69_00012231 [Brassica cretica]